MRVMDVLAGMTPLDLDLPEPPLAWWSVTLKIPRDGDEPLVDPGLRLPPELELGLLSESVVSMRVPAVDEVAAIVAASQVVRVLLGRWPGLLSAGVGRACP